MAVAGNANDPEQSLAVHTVSTRGSAKSERIVITPINANAYNPKSQRRFTKSVLTTCNAISIVHLHSKDPGIRRDTRNLRNRLLAVATMGLRHAIKPNAVDTANDRLATLRKEVIRNAEVEFQFRAILAAFLGAALLATCLGILALITQGILTIAPGFQANAEHVRVGLLLMLVFSLVFSLIRILLYTYSSSATLDLGMLREMIELSSYRHFVKTATLALLMVITVAGVVRGIPFIAGYLPPLVTSAGVTQWNPAAAIYYGLSLGVLVGFFDRHLFKLWRKALGLVVGKDIDNSSA